MKDNSNSEDYQPPSSMSNNSPLLIETKSVVAHNETKTCDYPYMYYYLSDLHLDYEIQDIHNCMEEIKKRFCSIIDEIFSSAFNVDIYGFLPRGLILLGGDVSHDPTVVKLFLDLFRLKFSRWRLIYVLGNHELWNFTENGMNAEDYSAEQIIGLYREYCYKNNIIFLENDILVINRGEEFILSEEHINRMSDEELSDLLSVSEQIILGGIGFAGKNTNFNASTGIYRDTIKSVEEEKLLSERFESVYHKLNRVLGQDNRIIVFTHMPYFDWTEDSPNPNWTYVYGHTHKNTYVYNQSLKIIADNQWGYYKHKHKLKSFFNNYLHNAFSNKPDGIYRISHQTYVLFYWLLGYNIDFSKIDGQVYLLKNHGFYFFMYKTEKKLCYLKGGYIRNCRIQNIEYYFENMPYVGMKITSGLDEYMSVLQGISSAIQKIGGEGSVHGCIVDIDFTNHLYVNPYDYTITPYFAPYDTVTKYVYPNLLSLLKNNCSPDLSENYIKLLNENNLISQLVVNQNNSVTDEGVLYTSTDIYHESRIIKSLQYAWNDSIIRDWIDSIAYKVDLKYVSPPTYEIKDLESNSKYLKPTNVFTLESSLSQKVLQYFLEDNIKGFTEVEFNPEELLEDFLFKSSWKYHVGKIDAIHEELLAKIEERIEYLHKLRKAEVDLLFKTICCDYVINIIKGFFASIGPDKLFRNKSKLSSKDCVVSIPISVCCDPTILDISHFVDSGLFAACEDMDSISKSIPSYEKKLIDKLISDICESLMSIGETNRYLHNKDESDVVLIDEEHFFKEICKKTIWQQKANLFELSRQELINTADIYLLVINESCKRKYALTSVMLNSDNEYSLDSEARENSSFHPS